MQNDLAAINLQKIADYTATAPKFDSTLEESIKEAKAAYAAHVKNNRSDFVSWTVSSKSTGSLLTTRRTILAKMEYGEKPTASIPTK